MQENYEMYQNPVIRLCFKRNNRIIKRLILIGNFKISNKFNITPV